ncbi:GNAT family N-acetyltransferase [Paenibacillus alvei]|uniref:GNAT family N-acetyltransferase n=1 Tax=Paenibacillus alvei TaxID=44250 RepID=A0ABT4GZQ6_PAEAL|nr:MULTISPECIES: GNAT family N-acetyltransferase [Paenibacillus]EJW15953.1 hypothetical protein PAV_6c00310 [Paenibacillus alvei DSM 29]MCY7482786.1 GNAT family N-acetyltransferase [Paenibacillus alvei]MCY9540066.1 GNAT family N-acetyltransferase [Paenibacillus alvei]MCY9704688.1 GNAT family N-acetyltransferase [Paenibacillus alvei]MCY9732652.1 GNAT family N-acetyltransferase [Paenibacillus alvei]
MIRKAIPEDSKSIIPLMMEAIGTIAYELSGTTNIEDTIEILEQYYLQSGNRLSWENCIVWEQDQVPVGYGLAYPGYKLVELDRPLEARLSAMQGKPVQLVKETEGEEYYLDSLAVHASQRGMGVGTKLMKAFEEEAVQLGFHTTSLIVNVDNTRAKQLYETQGYAADGIIISIAGEDYEHMVKKVK